MKTYNAYSFYIGFYPIVYNTTFTVKQLIKCQLICLSSLFNLVPPSGNFIVL